MNLGWRQNRFEIAFSVSTLHELAFLDRFNHVGIVVYHGYYRCVEHPETITLVIEYCDYSLADGVSSHIKMTSIVNPFKVIHQVAQALSYMHLYKCIHRDVEPANILIKRQGQ